MPGPSVLSKCPILGPPAITVVVPCRNAVGTLNATVASIRAQTTPRWEAVLVDDGSTDGTAALLKEHSRRDARIRCITGPRRGPAAARNFGVSAARAPWILLLDADDVMRPTAAEVLLEAADQGPMSVVISAGFEMLSERGHPLGVRHFPASGGFTVDRLLQGNHIPPMTLVPRSLLLECPLNEDKQIRGCEDWDLWLRLADRGIGFVSLPMTLYGYRLRHGSLSHDPDQMFAAASRVLDSWLPRGRDADLPNEARLRTAWTYAAVAAAQGEPNALKRYLQTPLSWPMHDAFVSFAASTLRWAYVFAQGPDGKTWASDGQAWRAETADWLAKCVCAESAAAILRELERQLTPPTAGTEAIAYLLSRKPEADRVIIYGLGTNGLALLEHLRSEDSPRRNMHLGIADDSSMNSSVSHLGLPIERPREWREWPSRTVVVITPNDPDAMQATLIRAGGVENLDFVALHRRAPYQQAGAA